MRALLRTVALTGVAGLAIGAPVASAVPPAAPGVPDLVAASDSGPSPTDNITSDTTPAFTVDAGVSSFGMTVTLYKADKTDATSRTAVATGLVGSDGLATLTATQIGDGTYVFTATTRNSSNEESPSSTALDAQIDTVAPVVLEPPSLLNFVGADPNLTYTQTPTFRVYGEVGSQVDLFEGTTLVGSSTVDKGDGLASYAEILVSTALLDGVHTLYAVATDKAGNTSTPSPTVAIRIDSEPPPVSKPDLVAADDDGLAADDDTTSNPRPRLTVLTEAGARAVLLENGIAIGSGLADASGIATVRVTDVHWLDPGQHCLYAIALDPLGNASSESEPLCVTITAGVAPFTSNLGLELGEQYLTMRIRSSLAGIAVVKALRAGKTVKLGTARVKAGRTTLRLRLPAALRRVQSFTVVASVRSDDGRRNVHRRVAAR